MSYKKGRSSLVCIVLIATLLASAFAANNASVSTFPLEQMAGIFQENRIGSIALNAVPSIESEIASGKTIALEMGKKQEVKHNSRLAYPHSKLWGITAR